MAVKAYILINLVATNIVDTIKNIRRVDGVKFADAITGPYDAIALIEANDTNEIGRIVTSGILKVPGVTKTLTCIAV